MSNEAKEVTGLRPRVNEAREFIEIAKDFKRPQELLREALSNSWDANASTASITIEPMSAPGNTRGRKKQLLNITIQDDGEGMNEDEIGYFFNLGDSHKPLGSIGTKGHGTKIYYKSDGIRVTTHKDGMTIEAATEMPPGRASKRESFLHIDTRLFQMKGEYGVLRSGSAVFDSPHSEFENLNDVTQYIRWNTIGGSLKQAMLGNARKMQINLKLPGMTGKVTLQSDFEPPDEQPDMSKGTSSVIKSFPISP